MLKQWSNLILPFLLLCLVIDGTTLSAQEKASWEQSFENLDRTRTVPGIAGQAFNLSRTAKERTPLQFELAPSTVPNSFTFLCWVKGVADFENYQMIDLQFSYPDSSQVNWSLNKLYNQSWSWNYQAGKSVLSYEGTYKHQPIHQDWTLLAMVIDQVKEEATLYYNSRQVAIYSMEGLLKKEKPIAIHVRIGGEEKGELQEWESFNGQLDDMHIFPSTFTADQVNAYYQKHKPSTPIAKTSTQQDTLRIMSFNIWHGGNETGKAFGYERIAELIKSSKADVVAMQETYGSGAKIADELGFYFYLRSTNIAILSRYPILSTFAAYKPFNNANAYIQIGKNTIAMASVWLNYPIDYWANIENKKKMEVKEWKTLQEGNTKTMRGIIQSLNTQLERSEEIPVFICGDFNSGSHLDYVKSTRARNAGYIMPFPTSIFLDSLGFRDTYREIHPDPVLAPGTTRSPIHPKVHQDRIDYIYVKNKSLQLIDSRVIDSSKEKYPSDHAAVISTFILPKKP